ncbi:MAG: alpha-L-fucosidase, partial [Lentisphaeraceae bacterium]|nr:alpha-L-fucosidase [Lentisphaeraceae bacterium]
MKRLLSLLLLASQFTLLAKDTNDQVRMDELWGDQGIALDAGKRGAWFKQAKYAMFVHWGLYSGLAGKWQGKTHYGIGEWIMNKRMAGISVNDYRQLAEKFNPVKFNAKAWVKLAKDSGMKYIVITAKHHDGFAMYKSKSSFYNIVDASPFKRDPLKELSYECHRQGLGFGFYYSQYQDWNEKDAYGNNWDFKNEEADFQKYFEEKCYPQVKELVTEYGPLAVMWFDTPGKMTREHSLSLVNLVRKHQPQCLINSRIGNGVGDYSSLGDMEIPPHNESGLWECVDTTNNSWSYAWYDQNWKSSRQIAQNVVSVVARGGTYMLNVGPRGDGTIPQRAQENLLGAG